MANKQVNVFLFDALTINQFYYWVWAQPADRRVESNPAEFWVETAKLCERGLLDGIFFDTLPDFVDQVVPELQRRGRFRTSYPPGETLRERLSESGPWVGPEHPAHRYRNAFSAVPH